MAKTINIPRDFSKYPFGRYPRHGQNNGEKFREEVLLPAILANESVIVELDGIDGEYGSSFLEESFGGAIRRGISYLDMQRKLRIVTSQGHLKILIEKYMLEASE